jgi:hypothetical protein
MRHASGFCVLFPILHPSASQVPPADIVQLAAAVEQYSEHPIAAAILSFADSYLAAEQGPGQKQQQEKQQQEKQQQEKQQLELGGAVVLGLRQAPQQGVQRAKQQELVPLPGGRRGAEALAGPGQEEDSQPLLAQAIREADSSGGGGGGGGGSGSFGDAVVVVTTTGAGSGGGGQRPSRAGRLPARDVEVVVGEGISGWVPLPPAGLSSTERLAALQLDHSLGGGSGSGTGSGSRSSSRAASPARSPTRQGRRGPGAGAGAALGAPAPLEVKVVVGNKRMMASCGVAVPQAAESYMREMEVGGFWGSLHVSISVQ